MNREAAIKLLPPEMVSDPGAIQRFHREVQAAAQLSHPNIVMTYDAGEMRGVHYLVMEFIDGVDLSKRVKNRGPMPVNKAITYMLQAAEGLKYAHINGESFIEISNRITCCWDEVGRSKFWTWGWPALMKQPVKIP